MSDIPSRDALRTAVVAAAWTEVFINDATADAILDAILPLVLAGAGEALEPMAWIAEHDIGETESDKDRFKPMFNHNRAPWLIVGDFRRARAVHAQINTLIGEQTLTFTTDIGPAGGRVSYLIEQGPDGEAVLTPIESGESKGTDTDTKGER